MRSIVEEASTIQKAIIKAWEQAGQPKEFSTKVLEMPLYNFFGMTKRSAKVALYFAPVIEKNDTRRRKAEQPKKQEHPKRARQGRPIRDKKSPAPTPQEKESKPAWTPELIDAVESWLHNILAIQDKQHIAISCKPKKRRLIISLASPLLDDNQSEETAFAGLSHLLVKMLQRQFKEQARHIRVSFVRA